MSQSDKAAKCKQQDMNYATRIQLQQVCEKTKEAIDTGTLALAKLTGCDFILCSLTMCSVAHHHVSTVVTVANVWAKKKKKSF